jgi:hypothetical protein
VCAPQLARPMPSPTRETLLVVVPVWRAGSALATRYRRATRRSGGYECRLERQLRPSWKAQGINELRGRDAVTMSPEQVTESRLHMDKLASPRASVVSNLTFTCNPSCTRALSQRCHNALPRRGQGRGEGVPSRQTAGRVAHEPLPLWRRWADVVIDESRAHWSTVSGRW